VQQQNNHLEGNYVIFCSGFGKQKKRRGGELSLPFFWCGPSRHASHLWYDIDLSVALSNRSHKVLAREPESVRNWRCEKRSEGRERGRETRRACIRRQKTRPTSSLQVWPWTRHHDMMMFSFISDPSSGPNNDNKFFLDTKAVVIPIYMGGPWQFLSA
jgi:hypothetical protein